MSHLEFRTITAEDLQGLIRVLNEELFTIYQAINEASALDLRVVNDEPHRPRDGMIVFADGTDWNPGAGRGLYVYDGGWEKITHA